MARSIVESEHWGSRLGAVLAVAGSAVGLGNFLRFPGQVVKYGGGAFMLPYFISLLLVAIPLASLEWAFGRKGGRMGRHSPMGIYYEVGGRSRFWGLCGAVSTLSTYFVGMYYIFIESWCLFYALQYLGGCLDAVGLGFSLAPGVGSGVRLENAGAYSEFFGSLVGSGGNGTLLPTLALVAVACAFINFQLIYLGVSKGIERFSKIAAPAIVVCSLIVIARVVTLGNPSGIEGQSFLDGLGFMWNPVREAVDEAGVSYNINFWATLTNPETWLAATSQIFFTASICFGSICSYASYVRADEDVALTSLTATATNEFCEVVLGGFMAIPAAIMFLGSSASEQFTSSFALGFTVLPNVFGQMPFGQFVGFAFFALLFFAAVTSSLSQLQPITALFQEGFNWSRQRATLVCSFFYLTGATIVAYFTQNLVALDVFDFWVGNLGPFLFGIFQTTLIAFVWKLPNLQAELERGAKIKLPRSLGFIAKWISLPYLLVVFAMWCRYNLGGKLEEASKSGVAQFSMAFIGAGIVVIVIVALRVMKRWRQEGGGPERQERGAGE